MDENDKTQEDTEEVKRGARNSRNDSARLQQIHDYAVENGAMCAKKTIDMPGDTPSFIGGAVKALDENGKVGGYLVTRSDETSPDLTGDYFSKITDFGNPSKLPVLYHHGFDKKIGNRRIGTAEITDDEVGLWAEAQLELRDEYEKMVFDLAKAGKLGWSSGAASHTVNRKQGAKANEITQWYIAEASLTPTPAEFRNSVVPIKSLITPEAVVADKDDETKTQKIQEELDMEKEEFKAMLDDNNKSLIDTVKAEAQAAAQKAVDDVLDKLPEVKAKMGATVEVVVDESDREFKSLGDQLKAVADATRNGKIAPRIRGLKAMESKAALGLNEAIPSQGEFLLEPTITSTLLQNVHDTGVFTQSVQSLPVGPNSNSGWIPGVDETSRASGSRWGGVIGYHAAESASMTASKPKFRKINWELHKAYVLQYATDELLNDVGMMNAIITKSSMEEIDFMANYDVLLGIGGDRPVGMLRSNALISIARAATSAIAHADIVGMWQRMLPRSKPKSSWFISSDVHAQLDQLTFTSGTTGILSPYIGYGPDGVMRIYGRPVVETEFNPALGTLGDIFLADPSEYLYWEKNAVEAASSIHVQFLTDETAFRFIYRYDGQTARASALTPANGSANTQSPFVALLATT